MHSPFFLSIRGSFVIVGKEPDGDSVRFIANNLNLYQQLKNRNRIKPSADNSVQLRFEGVDAPELHYGRFVQPMGNTARDFTLEQLGFTGVTYGASGTTATSSTPASIPGCILTQGAETHGRPVSYVLLGHHLPADGRWIRLTAAILRQTLNYKLVTSGNAYVLAYTSMPFYIYEAMRQAGKVARQNRLGVWQLDATPFFELKDHDSIGVNGKLIFPKLFRRCCDYLDAVAKQGFIGNLSDWLVSTRTIRFRNEDDLVEINEQVTVHLSELVRQQNDSIAFDADLLQLRFVEKV